MFWREREEKLGARRVRKRGQNGRQNAVLFASERSDHHLPFWAQSNRGKSKQVQTDQTGQNPEFYPVFHLCAGLIGRGSFPASPVTLRLFWQSRSEMGGADESDQKGQNEQKVHLCAHPIFPVSLILKSLGNF